MAPAPYPLGSGRLSFDGGRPLDGSLSFDGSLYFDGGVPFDGGLLSGLPSLTPALPAYGLVHDEALSDNVSQGSLPEYTPGTAPFSGSLSGADIGTDIGPQFTAGTSGYAAGSVAEGEAGIYSLIRHSCAAGLGAAPQFVGYAYLSALSQNGLIRAGTETVADEMTKKWISLAHSGESETVSQESVIPLLQREMRRFRLQKLFNEAAEKTGYFGGCLAYIDLGPLADEELKTPLLAKEGFFAPGSLRGFTLIEPVNISPGRYNARDPLQPFYFTPETWLVGGKEIHHTRFLYFVDNEPPLLFKPAYNFFGIPMAQIALDYVAHFTESRTAAIRLLNKFSLTIFKTNMSGVLQGGATEDLDNRMRYFADNRSNDGVAVIDKEDEDIVKLETSLSGVTDIVRQSLELLAAIFRIPTIKFLGMTPGGLNATGENDMLNHYDNIAAQQEKQLRAPLEYALDILQMNACGRIDESVVFSFVPLAADDARNRADMNKTKAETAAILIDKGVISAEEARKILSQDATLS